MLQEHVFSALRTNINCSAFQNTCMMGVSNWATRTTTLWATGNLASSSHIVVTLPSGFRDRGMECDNSIIQVMSSFTHRSNKPKCGNVFWLLKDTIWLLLIWYRWPGAPGWGWNPEHWADGGSHVLQSKDRTEMRVSYITYTELDILSSGISGLHVTCVAHFLRHHSHT